MPSSVSRSANQIQELFAERPVASLPRHRISHRRAANHEKISHAAAPDQTLAQGSEGPLQLSTARSSATPRRVADPPGSQFAELMRTRLERAVRVPAGSLDVPPGRQLVALAACLMSWATTAGW